MKTFTVQYAYRFEDIVANALNVISRYGEQLYYTWDVSDRTRTVTFLMKRTSKGYGVGVFHWHAIEERLSMALNVKVVLSDVVDLASRELALAIEPEHTL
jgi:hypothetical protein